MALPDPLVQMNSELHRTDAQPVLTYRTSDPDPQYLQVYVLSNLSAQTWTLAPATGLPVQDGKLPAAPGLARGTPSNTEHAQVTLAKGLTSGQQTASFLPLPYPARTVDVAGTWRADPRTLTMFSAQSLSGLSYSVASREVSPTVQQLQLAGAIPAGIANNYLRVPAVFQPLTSLAERVTRGQSTAYGEAVALQRWFTSSGKFRYSLDVSEPGTAQALIRFLTVDRRGYCQQFAFAMAVLARLLDIPSRVAVGYTAGSATGPRPLGSAHQRRPRLAGTVFRGGRLAAFRADPGRIGRPGHRQAPGVLAAPGADRPDRDGHPADYRRRAGRSPALRGGPPARCPSWSTRARRPRGRAPGARHPCRWEHSR